jgi:hypothetical protein
MKRVLIAAALMAATSTQAFALTYVGNRTIGTGSANLSITTDGTIGVLNQANITGWTIGVTDANGTFTLQGPNSGNNSQLLISGTALTATATDLLFNFGASSGFALFQNPSIGSSGPFYCPQINGCFDFSGPGEGVLSGGPFNPTRNSLRGNVVLASVAGPVVPEPATWAMMIFGFGAVGGAMRARKVSVSYA